MDFYYYNYYVDLFFIFVSSASSLQYYLRDMKIETLQNMMENVLLII